MVSQADANAYDAARLTDTNLVDVTPANTSAPANGNGWFVRFNDWTEKTSSAGLLLGGCTIWNTLTPNTTQFVCGNPPPPPPKDNANLYQADAITGAVACGTSTQSVRYVTRTTIVPPVSPTPVVSVNAKTGQVTYSGVSIEPGNPPLQLTVGGGDILGTINWLEVPREVHNCRHSTSGTPNCPQ
jgi:type IV pilus assembly protein PilY1